MMNQSFQDLLARLAAERGTAGMYPVVAGSGGGSPFPIDIRPASAGRSAPVAPPEARAARPPSSGGILGRLLSGLQGASPGSGPQVAPAGGNGSSGPGNGFMSGLLPKAADFAAAYGLASAFGGNANQAFGYGLQGLYGGIADRRQRKEASAELNRTRMAAIKLGVPEEVAMNAPVPVLMEVIKEAHKAGLQQTTLNQGDRRIDAQGNLIAENPAAPDMPTLAKEYEWAVANGYQGTIEEFMKIGKGPQTVIDMGGDSYNKESGKLLAALRDDLRKRAGNARKAIGTLGRMETAMSDPNFYSGTGGDMVARAKKAAVAFGLNPEQVASMEEFASLANQSVLNDLGSLGAGVSNKDVDFIQGTVASLDKTPAGNLRIIKMKKRLAERDLEINNLATQYVQENGRLDDGWDAYLNDWAEANPMFSEQPDTSGAPQPDGDGWTTLPNGVRIRQK